MGAVLGAVGAVGAVGPSKGAVGAIVQFSLVGSSISPFQSRSDGGSESGSS